MRNCRQPVEGKTLATPGREGNWTWASKARGTQTTKEKRQRRLHRDRAVGWLEPIFTSVCFPVHTKGRSAARRNACKRIHSFSREYTWIHTHTHGHAHTNTGPPCTWTGLVGKASPPPHAPKDPPAATACFGTAAWTSPVYCEGFPENTHRSWLWIDNEQFWSPSVCIPRKIPSCFTSLSPF